MINFLNDYSDIAHEIILKKLYDLRYEKNIGYGKDLRTEQAKSLIQKQITTPVDIHFLSGGTITNKTVISHLLKPFEAVIAPKTGHIEVHETGAIESTGHKIIAVETSIGKLEVDQIDEAFKKHVDEHMVKPKMVYISNSTETGFIYTKKELSALYAFCQKRDLFLFLDGARLGVALTSDENDLSLNDVVNYTDVCYIGGTKNGALLGEALIIKNKALNENFRYSIKQNGGLLAKGFIVGIQFEALFENDLFYTIGKKANSASKYLKSRLNDIGVVFVSTPTNQQFITLSTTLVEVLEKKYLFEIWTDHGDMQTIRLVTTYQTTDIEIDTFIDELKKHI